MTPMKVSWAVIIAVAILGPMAATALAAPPLWDTPVYDPVSKKYYALINARADAAPYPRYEGLPWEFAYNEALSRVYKGVRGRLAVVNTNETHEFLLRTFHPDTETWIGLRYWCSRHKLQWSDGTFIGPGSFSAWDPVWKQDAGACNSEKADHPKNSEEFMPVAYSKGGFRWIGKGWDKRYVEYFIEFPTGQP